MKNRLGALLDLLTWCKKHWAVIEPTQEWIAGKLGWTLRTCQRWIAVAKRLGRLKVSPRYRRTAIYELLPVPCDAQMSFDFSDGGVNGGAELKPQENPCSSSSTDISRFERHQHRDAVETATEETVRKSAGIERLSEGDRVFIRDLERSGVPAEVIRGGVFLGRARRMVSESGGRVSGAIRSVRYFAESITEAAKHPIGYLEHVERFVVRNQKKSA